MRKLQLIAIVALIMLGFSGCEKSAVTNEAYPDVFVKTIKNTQGDAVFAAIHSVISYSGVSSVSVKAPDGTVTQLINYQNSGYSFYNEPAVTDYLPTPPAAGIYTYTVKFNNAEEKTYTNALTNAILAPANISALVKSTNGDTIYITWDAIANVDYYQLIINRGTSQVFFADNLLDSNTPKKTFMKFGIAKAYLTSGTSGTYSFEMAGKLYETTGSQYLQAISSATKTIDL